jgi:putative flippase GtrA
MFNYRGAYVDLCLMWLLSQFNQFIGFAYFCYMIKKGYDYADNKQDYINSWLGLAFIIILFLGVSWFFYWHTCVTHPFIISTFITICISAILIFIGSRK